MKNHKLKEADFRRYREILESDPVLREIVDSAIAESSRRKRRRVRSPWVDIPKTLGRDGCWLRDRDVLIRWNATAALQFALRGL